ncbi:MAG: hypothetical protein A2X34_09335 [Elusimicrobia bacterium GWC2_51_8]|nr:MAG: hypothetical protein A2X33_01105 [Elusimicrobia bacterium GWA2_51_34]OGR60303.1 MAG: hypothetical protein A2X34_09335 [Elusimicrobia bacterium GWC2_51_8]OGR85872.1 MAG: hypothetical protein A2021_03270 [Elusimicrobia bacterium GWF2_52_66]HAF96124.1 hypothetical protein [Elusimicrobiota bacterium]HCE97249.1 hypothetical protein [Elusimicrobiota bacterium]
MRFRSLLGVAKSILFVFGFVLVVEIVCYAITGKLLSKSSIYGDVILGFSLVITVELIKRMIDRRAECRGADKSAGLNEKK